jgi:hypothetical protein
MLRLRVPAGGGQRATAWVAGAGGLLPGLPASVPLGLPRSPGSFHPRRRGAGHLLGAAGRADVQVRLGQAPPTLSTTAGQHGRDREFPGPAGPASSPASLAMRFSTGATGARPAATLAVPGQSSPGRRCGSRSPRRGPGPAPRPFPFGLLQPPCAREPGSGLAAPAGLPNPPVDRYPPIAPAVFRNLDAVAVLTARLLPAPRTLGRGWLCP